MPRLRASNVQEQNPMSTLAEEIDRAAPARRPAGPLAGYHRWHNLSFVHWRVPAEMIEPLLPRSLTLDTFDGCAWVGLVPFSISGLRPWWFPPLPGVSAFNEINVRTYVHHRGRDPGVWFCSLNANCRLAASVARCRWHLNYFFGRVEVRRTGNIVRYEAARRAGRQKIGARVVAQIGQKLGHDEPGRALAPGRTLPGTLEHFLLDRYILYAQQDGGPLYQARVHHVPYAVDEARLLRCDQTLLAASGIAVDGPPCHIAFCERADVEMFPLRRVDAMSRNRARRRS
jgi:uncharacterized protein YqjF (DUF2071 family)